MIIIVIMIINIITASPQWVATLRRATRVHDVSSHISCTGTTIISTNKHKHQYNYNFKLPTFQKYANITQTSLHKLHKLPTFQANTDINGLFSWHRRSTYGQTANEDPRKSEFEPQRISNVEGGLSLYTV